MLAFISAPAPAFSISYFVVTLDAAFKVSMRGGSNVTLLADGPSEKYEHFS